MGRTDMLDVKLLSDEEARELLILAARPGYTTRPKFEEYVKKQVAKDIRAREEEIIKSFEVSSEYGLIPKRNQGAYIEDILEAREPLTFDFVDRISKAVGRNVNEYFPLNNKLPDTAYNALYKAVTGTSHLPEHPIDVRFAFGLLFCMYTLPRESAKQESVSS